MRAQTCHTILSCHVCQTQMNKPHIFPSFVLSVNLYVQLTQIFISVAPKKYGTLSFGHGAVQIPQNSLLLLLLFNTTKQ